MSAKELCSSCRDDINEEYQIHEHSCLSNEYLGCVDGKDCPEYVEYCPCECNKIDSFTAVAVPFKTNTNQ